MRIGLLVLTVVAVIVGVSGSDLRAQGREEISFDIPPLENVKFEGDLSQWKDAFHVEMLAGKFAGDISQPGDFSPRFLVGYNNDGLLIAADVKDDAYFAAPLAGRLQMGDSIEIILAEHGQEKSNGYVVQIAPGVGDLFSQARINFVKSPSRISPQDAIVKAAARKTPTGYILEALLPWSNLQLHAGPGLGLGIQLYAFDRDKENGPIASRYWHPNELTYLQAIEPGGVYALRLAEKASPASQIVARTRWENAQTKGLQVTAPAALAGRQIALKDVAKPPAILEQSLTLQKAGEFSTATFDMPSLAPPAKAIPANLDVFLDDVRAANVAVRDGAAIMVSAIELLAPSCDVVFAGDEFPAITWNLPDVAQQVSGTTEFSVKYFDDAMNQVTKPAKPGRYAAVLESKGSSPSRLIRYLALCKAPPEITTATGTWTLAKDGLSSLPEFVSKNAEIQNKIKWNRDNQRTFAPSQLHSRAFCATLAEIITPGETGNPQLDEMQYWATLKFKITSTTPPTAESVKSIDRIHESDPAMVLGEGTPQQAGVDPALVDRLDLICKTGVEEFPAEPLSFCIAHNGVVFFHRAYGKKSDGSPMTIKDPVDLTSQTKMLSAIVAMSLSDRGLVEVDKPLGQYITEFKDIKSLNSLTLHHFFSHMSGLGDRSSHPLDVAEVTAEQLPYLKPMNPAYSSAGYWAAASVLERQTGIAFPKLFRKLLLEPLDMSSAEVVSPSGGASMTVFDLAKVGQMLLNQGAYGDVRILRKSTIASMLPKKEWGPRGGIGLYDLGGKDGWSTQTIGHPGGHSGIFRVDPARNLIVVVGSINFGQQGFRGKYQVQLFNALRDSIRR